MTGFADGHPEFGVSLVGAFLEGGVFVAGEGGGAAAGEVTMVDFGGWGWVGCRGV